MDVENEENLAQRKKEEEVENSGYWKNCVKRRKIYEKDENIQILLKRMVS